MVNGSDFLGDDFKEVWDSLIRGVLKNEAVTSGALDDNQVENVWRSIAE